MHVLMLKEVIACCRQRQAEGDCPTGTAFSVEQLENAVVQLADRLHEAEGRLLAAAGPKLDPRDAPAQDDTKPAAEAEPHA